MSTSPAPVVARLPPATAEPGLGNPGRGGASPARLRAAKIVGRA
ncbi:protein of unassigned function [Methylobacterium oryzae CBMB20]|uniref:Protein of unassigned function n=1 Tax=Methylobacterium oryzae CBMB20 TaxID=693986 RepID=A0A089NWM7_9HYPH|nr:protein of unassigned function [Methylobacterium oryzae CBMB20]